MPLTAAAMALALTAGADPPAATVAPLVVEAPPKAGEALRERVHAYVGRVATPPPHGETLVRWKEPICPLVAGLPQMQGEYILARLTLIARTVGAPVAGEHCAPNLYVVVTGQPEALLRQWRRRDVNLFGQQPPARVGRFIGTDRPLRVWRNWSHTPADGARPTEEFHNSAALGHVKDSRIVSNVVRSGWGAVAVVDAGRIQGVSVAQIADYIALNALAEVNPDAGAPGAPTILSLFDDAAAAAPDSLTAWDQAFLTALYGGEQENLRQRAQIAARMAAALAR